MSGLDPAVALALRAALALLFATTAWHKLRAPVEFRAAIAGFGLVPARAVSSLATALVAAEAAVVLALLGRPALGGAGAAVLLLVYAAAMGLALARGRGGVDCGCGGAAGGQPVTAGLVARNLALALAALPLLAPAGDRPLGVLDGVTVAGSVAAVGALFAAANGVLATAPRLRALRDAAAEEGA